MRALVLMLAGTIALTGCGDEDADAPAGKRSTAAKPAITPLPDVDFVGLKPGVEYTTRVFKPNLRFTLPEGKWTAPSADDRDHVELEVETEQPIQDAGIGFHHMTKVFDPEAGGEEPGDAVDGPEDFAAWLTDHPHLKTTEPEPVEALGLKGVSIDLRGAKGKQKRQYKDCGKLEGSACVVGFVGGIEPIVYGEKSFARFLVLEQPGGGQLVVEVWAEPLGPAEAEVERLAAILADASVIPG